MRKVLWIDATKGRPHLGQTVFVFEQGYGDAGNYYCDYRVARYIEHPGDRRRRAFADALAVSAGNRSPWVYHRVTHWMPLPAPPERTNPGQIDAKGD